MILAVSISSYSVIKRSFAVIGFVGVDGVWLLTELCVMAVFSCLILSLSLFSLSSRNGVFAAQQLFGTGQTKAVQIAILIIAAAILFVWVYPQLDRSAQQTIRDIQTGALADDTQTESPTVDDHTEADNGGVPTAAPEALAVGLRGVGETIHDTETMGEGSRDYTLNRVEVYDTIEDSPISLSECVPNTSYDTYQTWKFILLDMNVTNTSESEMEPRAGEEYQFMLDLIPRNEGDSQMLYFSAHPDSTNSASDYNKFNLAPGDTLNFQIGIFIEPSAWEEQSVYLQVGYDNASGVGFSYFS